MPELPEVQTVVNDLCNADLIGKTICSARVTWPRSLAVPSVRRFTQVIKGKQIISIWRRGKYIVFDLSDGLYFLVHLRMTGRLHLHKTGAVRAKHEHVHVLLDDGRELRLHDTRKFGKVYCVESLDAVVGSLGVEPLSEEFTRAHLKQLCHSRKRTIKPFLLDQTIIAGLGNIYVDEALWRARIHPLRISASLTDKEIAALHKAIPHVLKIGLKNMGTTLGTGKANFYSVARRKGRNRDALNVFRRTGMPCPECGTTIERLTVGQRSTHICRQCQK